MIRTWYFTHQRVGVAKAALLLVAVGQGAPVMVVAQRGGVGVGAQGQQTGSSLRRRSDEQLAAVPGRFHLGTAVVCDSEVKYLDDDR